MKELAKHDFSKVIDIACETGDRDAKRTFEKRLHEEQEHLLFVHEAVEKLSIEEVLGKDVKLPGRPPLDLTP